jgi:hypothetical protein
MIEGFDTYPQSATASAGGLCKKARNARVRPRRDRRDRSERAVRGRLEQGRAPHGLDEPWRPGHPEVVHMLDGAKLLSNFVHKMAGCPADWTMAAYRQEAIAKIRAQVGIARVICGLSGGVDSAVAAV